MDDAGEEDAHVRAGRWRDRRAALRARQAAPRKARQRIVLDMRIADTHRGALGEAMVVANVVLLGSVVDLPARRLDIVRLRVRAADRTLTDRNRDRDAHLRGFVVARHADDAPGAARSALVFHLLVGEADVSKAEVPAARG